MIKSCSNKQFSYYWIKLFITKHISNDFIKYNQYFYLLFGLYSSIFLWIWSISFEYSIRAFKLFKYFKPVLFLLLISNWYFASYGSFAYKKNLSMSGSWFIRLSHAFVFLDPKPLTINILYEWSGTSGQFGLCSFVFWFEHNQS